MGDRGNVVVRENGQEVWLYSHWDGSRLPEIVASALKRGNDRWDDAPYLARIIFSEMTKGSEMETRGYGIWVSEVDNENPIVVVNTGDRTVQVGDSPPVPIREFAAK